jgi:hypothetical protein
MENARVIRPEGTGLVGPAGLDKKMEPKSSRVGACKAGVSV